MNDKFLEIKSIDPEYWGKSGWIFLNSIALTYDTIYKDNYRQFILQLPYILPCKTCGENLKKNLSTLDNALESKENFILWLINVRNDIYIDNHTDWKQKNFKETIDEIFYSYSTKVNIYWWMFFSFLVLIMLIYLLKNIIASKE
jgi:hypothetical protein